MARGICYGELNSRARAQYRDEEPEMLASNIMFDRRVVRGSTYAAKILPASMTQGADKSKGSLST